MTRWITAAAGKHSHNLAAHLEERTGANRRATRAQVRRVAARLPTFKRVEISFEGVTDVGHGFVEELFRGFGRAHPEVELVPTAMTAGTAALIRSARAA